MNWLDGLVLGLLAAGGFFGWYRGFVRAALDIATGLVSLVLGFRFYGALGALLYQRLAWSEIWGRPLAFFAIVIAGVVVIGLIANFVSSKTPIQAHRSTLNRSLGVLPGLFEAVVMAAMVVLLLLTMPFPASVSSAARRSPLADVLAARAENVSNVFTPLFGDAVSRLLYVLTPPDSPENIKLNFTVADPVPRPDLESEMTRWLNEQRTSQGLDALANDPRLVEVSRGHSADMLVRGYFSHDTPDGLTPLDRLRAANVTFLVSGENCALAPTLSIAEAALMSSPGHRENILRPQFGRVGIGIMDGGRYGLMITQTFTN